MLTDLKCKQAACPPEKNRLRLADSEGLYLEVTPNGSKRWMWKYRIAKREKRMAFGSYPQVTLSAARKARDAAKAVKATGVDPMADRQRQKLRSSNPAGDSFKAVALEWHEKQTKGWSPTHAIRTKRQLERDLFPYLGQQRIADITGLELLGVLRKIEQRGAVETANRGLMLARQIWGYAFATGRVERNMAVDLRGALAAPQRGHHAAILDPRELGALVRAIRAYKGGSVVRAALQLAPMLFQRPGELRAAEWIEFDLEAGMWSVPAMRMKRRKFEKENGEAHLVPLSTQAVQVLKELMLITGRGKLVFPGQRQHDRPLSDNSVRTALISMGYTPDVQTWHGFRATARTMLAERLEFDPVVIEAQLAHGVRDANGRAYNRTQYIDQRKQMMQAWSDYLDKLAAGNVVQLRAA